eukprot:scaffold310178_cov30-Tisochrysis_lutea.AAC.2
MASADGGYSLSANATLSPPPHALPLADLRVIWAVTGSISTIGLACTLLFLVGRLLNGRFGQSTFHIAENLLSLVEMLGSTTTAATCWFNLANGAYSGRTVCDAQVFSLMLCFTTTLWLNAVSFHEAHRLMHANARLAVYTAPLRGRALCRLLGALALCIILSTGPLWRGTTLQAFPVHGAFCVPLAPLALRTAEWVYVGFSCGPPLLVVLALLVHCIGNKALRRQFIISSDLPPLGNVSHRRENRLRFFIRYQLVWNLLLSLVWMTFFVLCIAANDSSDLGFWIGINIVQMQPILTLSLKLARPSVRKSVWGVCSRQTWANAWDTAANVVRAKGRSSRTSSHTSIGSESTTRRSVETVDLPIMRIMSPHFQRANVSCFGMFSMSPTQLFRSPVENTPKSAHSASDRAFDLVTAANDDTKRTNNRAAADSSAAISANDFIAQRFGAKIKVHLSPTKSVTPKILVDELPAASGEVARRVPGAKRRFFQRPWLIRAGRRVAPLQLAPTSSAHSRALQLATDVCEQERG